MKKIKEFAKGVAEEFKKIKWPNKKEMFKYTTATISFILFFAVLFEVTRWILTWIRAVIG